MYYFFKYIISIESEDFKFVSQIICLLYVDDLSLSFKDVNELYQFFFKLRERMI